MDRGWFLMVFTPDEVRLALQRLNTEAAARHYPNPDGGCPLCGSRGPCDTWIGAVRALRAAGVAVAVVEPHPPRRPQWDCEWCAVPWPCAQARVMLGDRYGPDRRDSDLVAYLRGMRRQAEPELHHVTDDELRERFEGWVNPWG